MRRMARAPVLILVVLILVTLASAGLDTRASQLFGQWFKQINATRVKLLNKAVSAAERQAAFAKNLATIDGINKSPHSTWKAGVTRFTGMTDAERRQYLSPNLRTKKGFFKRDEIFDEGDDSLEKRGFFDKYFNKKLPPIDSLPATFDWRDRGVVTPPKDQNQCGS